MLKPEPTEEGRRRCGSAGVMLRHPSPGAVASPWTWDLHARLGAQGLIPGHRALVPHPSMRGWLGALRSPRAQSCKWGWVGVVQGPRPKPGMRPDPARRAALHLSPGSQGHIPEHYCAKGTGLGLRGSSPGSASGQDDPSHPQAQPQDTLGL